MRPVDPYRVRRGRARRLRQRERAQADPHPQAGHGLRRRRPRGRRLSSPASRSCLCDGRYELAMQDDGNLVWYGPKGALWASGTDGKGGHVAVVQSDGNFVLYNSDSGGALSGRATRPATAAITSRSRTTATSSCTAPAERCLWESHTAQAAPPPPLPPCGTAARVGEIAEHMVASPVSSCSGGYTFVMQTDGNLARVRLWRTSRSGRRTPKASGDRVIVHDRSATSSLYTAENKPVWNAVTQGHPGAYLPCKAGITQHRRVQRRGQGVGAFNFQVGLASRGSTRCWRVPFAGPVATLRWGNFLVSSLAARLAPRADPRRVWPEPRRDGARRVGRRGRRGDLRRHAGGFEFDPGRRRAGRRRSVQLGHLAVLGQWRAKVRRRRVGRHDALHQPDVRRRCVLGRVRAGCQAVQRRAAADVQPVGRLAELGRDALGCSVTASGTGFVHARDDSRNGNCTDLHQRQCGILITYATGGMCALRAFCTQCSNNGVETCSAAGQWSTPAALFVCMGGATRACTPGATECSTTANAVLTCGADGQWGSSVSCVGQTCVSGACSGVCAPGGMQTITCGNCGSEMDTCDPTGNWAQGPCKFRHCAAGQYGYATCTNAMQPGAAAGARARARCRRRACRARARASGIKPPRATRAVSRTARGRIARPVSGASEGRARARPSRATPGAAPATCATAAARPRRAARAATSARTAPTPARPA